MAGNVKIVLNRKGIGDLLRSEEVRQELVRRATKIAAAAGPGHVVDSEIGPNRARAVVITATAEAMVAEATDRRLSAALDAGR